MIFDMQSQWRKPGAWICLLALVLLQAPAGAAAWFAHLGCCNSDHCKIPGHHHDHSKAPAAPAPEHHPMDHMDCGHETVGMTACSMSCCQKLERPMTAAMTFLLPLPTSFSTPLSATGKVACDFRIELDRHTKPLSPPPRFFVAV